MKALIADKFEESGVNGMRALGCEVIHNPELKDEALEKAIAETCADVLVVRSTKVTEPMLAAGRLSLVVRAGAGYNTIDVAAASRRGVYVSNCPGKNSVAVAELAFGLILALDRRIVDNVVQLRAGQWNKKEFSKAKGLKGRTLGLIGLGNIGREMIPRALAFEMPVVAWSRSLTREKADALEVVHGSSPEEVAGDCDVLSIHLALNNDTRGRIGASVFERMRPGSIFINTSRAEVVDQDALARAIRENGIRAGLDVFETEPTIAVGEFGDSIAELSGVYGTHHIGASTDQAQEAIAAETVRIVREFKETGVVPNVVNLCKQSPAKFLLVVRHLDRVGVLAHVFDELRAAGINVQETNNIVFDGAEAAVAQIRLDAEPDATTLSRLNQNENILGLSASAL